MNSTVKRVSWSVCLCLVFSLCYAQQGAQKICHDIKKLGVLANVLYVAAHPDDENTRLISYLSNHLYVNTTYLSMTRGDGGQNLIGSEMREMLGLIRTHELLEARRVDGGRQLFTRANDFGYSKTAAETMTIWERQEVLGDVVWAIRRAHPDIIINRFTSDTARPNHGHHTASAILSTEAFSLAADTAAYAEQLAYTTPWQPRRIFLNTSWWWYGSREAFDKVDKSKMVTIDIGAYDPVSGQSNSEIAGRSRSLHKSQGFGSAETRGESLEYLDLIEDARGTSPADLFDGIDITWSRVDGGAAIQKLVAKLESEFDFKAPFKSVPLLVDIHKAIGALPDSYWKQVKKAECEDLIKACLGLFIEARANTFRSSPGSAIPVTLEVINRSPVEALLESAWPSPAGTTVRLATPLDYNKVFLKELSLTAPARLSIPYWLVDPPAEGMYTVHNQLLRGVPADPPPLSVKVMINILNSDFTFTTPVVYKTVDPAEGEIYRPLAITPPVVVEPEAEALVFNREQSREIRFTLTAIEAKTSGAFRLASGHTDWKVLPESIPFAFDKAGESKTFTCTITPPAYASETTLRPEIHTGEAVYFHKIHTLDYRHLPYMSVVRDATVKLRSLPIAITPRPVAYIMGAGDDVPASLRQIGYHVDIIDPGTMTEQALDRYEVVMLGVRAFNTIDVLAYKNTMLMDWVKKGGTMIVQYNVSNGLVTQDIAPYPLTLSRDRVTEEHAPVRILAPAHEVFHYPNKITAEDFDGWVQERGLYFPSQWDEHFAPVLEMNDAGETPGQGALLIAKYGEGYYVYSGLSWFRHLPAGVPGAYRLVSNLLSLGYTKGKS